MEPTIFKSKSNSSEKFLAAHARKKALAERLFQMLKDRKKHALRRWLEEEEEQERAELKAYLRSLRKRVPEACGTDFSSFVDAGFRMTASQLSFVFFFSGVALQVWEKDAGGGDHGSTWTEIFEAEEVDEDIFDFLPK